MVEKVNRSLLLCVLMLSSQLMGYDLRVFSRTSEIDLKHFIENSAPNDTLIIRAGTYYVSGLVIDKPLCIIGEKGAIIDGAGKGQIMTIKANKVSISGLEFRNTPVSYISDNAAIKLDSAFDCHIFNNRFDNN